MEFHNNQRSPRKQDRSHRVGQLFTAAFAAALILAIAPRLPSATDPAAPTFTQTNLVSDAAEVGWSAEPQLAEPPGPTPGVKNAGLGLVNRARKNATSRWTGPPKL